MKATKVRQFIAAVVAIILIVVLAALIAAAAGKRIPLLSSITDMLGF